MANKSHMSSEKRKPKANAKSKAPAKAIASIVTQPELIKKPKKDKPSAE